MSRKIRIAFIFILMITLTTAYFLYQIDKHEKALIGREWLNSVPYTVWQNYLYKKQTYDKLAETYAHNNPELMKIIENYQKQGGKFNNNHVNFPISPLFRLPLKGDLDLLLYHPEENKIYEAILQDLKAHEYAIPVPSNPPTYAIQQSIRSLYRSMATIEAILLLAFITFMVLYKEKTFSKEQ